MNHNQKLTKLHYASVYSKHGVDGYLAEILSRIGTTNKIFVEIGVSTGHECNTRLLLESGWQGIWVDSNTAELDHAHHIFATYIQAGKLQIINSYLTPHNVNQVLANILHTTVDVLSVDTDQHTHCIWEALNLKSRVTCVEYNASLPKSVALEVPYAEGVSWDGTNYFGASLKSMELIGKTKHQSLVGCDSMGVDAFFVDSTCVESKFDYPFTAENHFMPPQYGVYKEQQFVGHVASTVAREWQVRA